MCVWRGGAIHGVDKNGRDRSHLDTRYPVPDARFVKSRNPEWTVRFSWTAAAADARSFMTCEETRGHHVRQTSKVFLPVPATETRCRDGGKMIYRRPDARACTRSQTPRRGANCFGTNLRRVSRMPVMECGVNRLYVSRRKRVAPTVGIVFFPPVVQFASTVHGSRSRTRKRTCTISTWHLKTLMCWRSKSLVLSVVLA